MKSGNDANDECRDYLAANDVNANDNMAEATVLCAKS